MLTPEGDDRHSRWHEAKVAEMASQVLENDTFYVTPLPADRKAIGSRWVVKEKPDKLKARFTPKGYAQKQDLDYKETWAPVAKLVTLRVFLTLVAILCLHTCQLDIKMFRKLHWNSIIGLIYFSFDQISFFNYYHNDYIHPT